MSRYTVYITPETFQELKNLPGNIKQRIRRVINNLADNPRPSEAKMLDVPNSESELWRLRIDNWRVIYAISEKERSLDIFAVRKRPPYDYEDLQELLKNLDEE